MKQREKNVILKDDRNLYRFPENKNKTYVDRKYRFMTYHLQRINTFVLLLVLTSSLLVGCSNQKKELLERMEAGMNALSENNPAAAKKCFEEVLDKLPTNIPALTGRAEALFRLGEYGRAEEDYTNVLKLRPDAPGIHAKRGECRLGLRQYEKAVDDFTIALTNKPDATSIRANRGYAWCELGKYDQALDDLNLCVKEQPVVSDYHRNRAIIYQKRKEYEPAIRDISRAIELEPSHPVLWSIRGKIYADSGQWDKALPDYTESIRRDIHSFTGYKYRGLYFKQMGDWNSALLDLNRAIDINPTDADCWFERASVYKQLKNESASQENMKRYHELTAEKEKR